tara:strand:- start:2960 stop:3247 length:288 start_codon:yes stop_codon:yes gene_type:complete
MSDFIDSLSEDALRHICAFALKASKSEGVSDSDYRALMRSILEPPSADLLEMLSEVAESLSAEEAEFSGRRLILAEQPKMAVVFGLDPDIKSPDS